MNPYYVLEGHTPVPVKDVTEWAMQFEQIDRTVKRTTLPDGTYISTVFLGVDHSYSDDGVPILFETMVFGGEHNEYQERYATWDEAEAGHERAIQMIFEVDEK